MTNADWFKQKITTGPTKEQTKECKKIIAKAKEAGVYGHVLESMIKYFKKNEYLTEKQKKYLIGLTEEALDEYDPDIDAAFYPNNSAPWELDELDVRDYF